MMRNSEIACNINEKSQFLSKGANLFLLKLTTEVLFSDPALGYIENYPKYN